MLHIAQKVAEEVGGKEYVKRSPYRRGLRTAKGFEGESKKRPGYRLSSSAYWKLGELYSGTVQRRLNYTFLVGVQYMESGNGQHSNLLSAP